MLPAASAGASFHAAISSGKFQGMIWPQTPTRLAQRVVEHLAGDGDGLALDLGGPAGEVLEVLDDLRQVDVGGLLDGLAVVGRLQRGQLAESSPR